MNENKQFLASVLNTLNTIEVRGYDNLNKLFGVMMAIQKELEKDDEKDGTSN